MDTLSEKFTRLYDRYSRDGEYCILCMALRRKAESVFRDSQGNLCRTHYKLYREEIEAINEGGAEFPPEFDDNAKRVYSVDDNFWMRFRFLEAMVDLKELSLEEAREQKAIVIKMLQSSLTPEERRQREKQRERELDARILPRTRL